MNDLSKLAQGGQPGEFGPTPDNERLFRIKGLECLVSTLKCMVEWSKDLYVNPNTLSILSEYKDLETLSVLPNFVHFELLCILCMVLMSL